MHLAGAICYLLSRRHAFNTPRESDRTLFSYALQYRRYQIRRMRQCARNGTSATHSARPAFHKTKHYRQVFRNSLAPKFRPDSCCSSSPNNFDKMFCLVASPVAGVRSARIHTFSGGARMRPPEWRARHQHDLGMGLHFQCRE